MILLVIIVSCAMAVGMRLMLSKSPLMMLAGVIVIGHGANLFLLACGRLLGFCSPFTNSTGDISNSIPQALILTAIVISLASVLILIAMIRGD